jgi:hypothetical protein
MSDHIQTTHKGKSIIWQPHMGPQNDFLASSAFEALTGGARGGGKSEGLIMDPLPQTRFAEFRGVFFRLTYPDLSQLIERTHKYYKKICPKAYWNGTEKEWRFPSGAKLLFRFLKNDDDWIHYQGHEYPWMGFEELTQFTEKQYINLMASCRTSSPRVRSFVRATCNPGGRGHNWVKARFVDPAPAGYRIIRDARSGLTRAFYPSTFRNNPTLLKNDPDYVRRLMMLPEADRKAMMDGDWDAFIGSVFKLRPNVHVWTWAQFNHFHNLPAGNRSIPREWNRYRSMDWGLAKPFDVTWYAVSPGGRTFAYREWYGVDYNTHGEIKADVGIRLLPKQVAERIVRIEAEAKEQVIGYADPSIKHQGSADYGGGPSIQEQFSTAGVDWILGDNDRIAGKTMLHNYLWYEEDPTSLEIIQYPQLIFIKEETPHAQRTIPALEYDKHIVEDVDTLMEDHSYDSKRYFVMARPFEPQPVLAGPQTRWDQSSNGGWA